MTDERRRDLWLFAGAFALRALWLADLSRLPFFDLPTSDSLFYASQATGIIQGQWLGTELAYPSSPLYPYLIAPFFLLGGRTAFWAIYLFQAALDALSAVFIRRTAAGLFGRGAGWVAGIAWAGYGLAVFFSGDLMEATMAAFLANLFLYLVLVARRPGAAGLALGTACLLRPHFLPLAGAAALLLFIRKGRPRDLRGAALLLAVAALPLSLSLARNVAVSGEPVLISPYGGLNAYLGNHPRASGYLSFPSGRGLKNDVDLKRAAHAYPEAMTGRELSETETSSFWWKESFRVVSADPLPWAGLMLRKARLFWSSYEPPNHLDFYFFRSASVPLSLAAVSFGLMAPLALMGLLSGLLPGAGEKERFLAVLTLTYALFSTIFFIGDRFRLPVTGWIFILASWSALRLAQALHLKRYALAGGTTAVALALALSLHVAVPADHGAREHVLVAASLAGRGRVQDAERLLRKAVELQPESAVARFNLGTHLARTGRAEEARLEIQEALLASPGFSAAHAVLGDLTLRLSSDDRPAAARHYREALRLEPYGKEAARIESALAALEDSPPAP